ncbi:progranulin-like isoform X1 [Danio aesculapii]|uniref:progranulin-like isoform X1 n=1 Tax=Danio aesculapii TaxID=1142201 RepID=UPI0024BF3C6B|nr:progranulin-like isoform X1 [Danio aesculapii]
MFPVLMLLMAALVAADEPLLDLSIPVETVDTSASVIHCDARTVCPDRTTCCRTPYGKWTCCPYSMGQCCRDGIHCCRHGYRCNFTSTRCLRGWLTMPSSFQEATRTFQKDQEIQTQAETVQCEGNFYCPAEKFCCKTGTGQWGCCSELEL